MGAWSPDSKTRVATMGAHDFRSNEQSVTFAAADDLKVELVARDGTTSVLKESIPVLAGEIVDATFMSARALDRFLAEQMADAKASGVLFSIHLKATMMKVSDPILFGHAVKTYFADVFAKHGDTFDRIGVNPNDGLADLLTRVSALPEAERTAIEADVAAALETGPALAMVDSERGITNLHVPSDIIIDASMPPMIRDSGKMWNAAGDLEDTKAVIPDSSYAGVYAAVVDDCRTHGAFDPATLGSVPNVGLMAQQAEEYGSHDKTFEIPVDGTVRVVNRAGDVVMQDEVEAGDVWRACQVKDAPVRDWVGLAVRRARLSGTPIVFWLDETRAHDAQLIAKVRQYLPDHDTSGLTIEIMAPADACRYSLERIRRGEDTISVTGNVLRDYLTDLFPIMELGTSAKMLSIVPLMNGGGLFETGAGGSAPKHVQQFVKENHLRWDSLGEFLALAASLEFLAQTTHNATAQLLADTLDRATGSVLDENRSPSRKVHELDNRGSHFYLALYWARELAVQADDLELAARFAPIAEALGANEEQIVRELNEVQGSPVDIGGYYLPDDELIIAAMRPSPTFNGVIDAI
jgi:isocitrate dehydrogenase